MELRRPVVEFQEIPVLPVHISLTGSLVLPCTCRFAGSALYPTLVLSASIYCGGREEVPTLGGLIEAGLIQYK